ASPLHLRAGHLLPGHRPARLRAHLRRSHSWDDARAPPDHGNSLRPRRHGHPALLRVARRTTARRARHQLGRVSHRRRRHARADRAGDGVRAAHRAPRDPRAGSRSERPGGHQRLPHGDSHARRPRLDRRGDARHLRRRWRGGDGGGAGGARFRYGARAARAAGGRAAAQLPRAQGGSHADAAARRATRGARRPILHRRDQGSLQNM
ncbi:MAG: MarC family integral membrane protein, partial [uncultured Sphingomonadaceae bacterium]